MRPTGEREQIIGPHSGPIPPYPLRLDGKVIRGFGRGSKELGIPTANIPVSGLTVGGRRDIESGIYYGWAGLSSSHATADGSPQPAAPADGPNAQGPDRSGGGVYPMVMSIGWNPFYKNTKRSVEVHIMHDFGGVDFYDSHMNLCILGFIRPEYDYVSREALVADIRTDMEVARRSLARDAYAAFRRERYLVEFEGRGDTAS